MDDKQSRWATQPGLEVIHYQDAPELSSNVDHGKEIVPQAYYGHTTPYAPPLPPHSPYPPPPPLPSPPAPTPWWKRRRFIIAIAVAAVVVVGLGAGLGAAFGAKKQSDGQSVTGDSPGKDTGTGSSGRNGTGTVEVPVVPQQARSGSPLTVSAMRKSDGGVDMRLFFLDRDNRLLSARCDTARPLGANETCWEIYENFSSFAEPDSRIAAGNIVWTGIVKPQTELFYTGSGTRLLGVNFNDQTSSRIVNDSINNMGYSTGPDSDLAAYWPWTVYQEAGGALVHVRNNPAEAITPADRWGNAQINVTALSGSRLAAVPVSTNYTRIADRGGYAVFYQGLDSRLKVTVPHLSELDSSYPLSFPIVLPAIVLPQKKAIAAFSAARPDDADQRVDAYVLYVDGSNNINMLYSDSSTAPATWKTVQPAALRGVDADTSIACVTMSTSGNNEAGKAVALEGVSEANACYFQKGGILMEAKMKGLEWSAQGVAITKVV
ncbi:hypothetical protein QBC39DRAFT_278051 [Podospora conica]|nr:hypothetical protein QBC39DRAFT_278051 [Schizothecium conicum]